MILNDKQIKGLCVSMRPMLAPFHDSKVRLLEGKAAVSFGASSFGYDISLAGNQLLVEAPDSRQKVGLFHPKRPDPALYVEAERGEDSELGKYFVIPPLTHALGSSIERFDMPPNIMGICMGKSTYARSGLIINLTPAEAGWEGHLTLELENHLHTDLAVYIGEGIAQVVFFEGEMPAAVYANGPYQNQGARPYLPSVGKESK